AYLSQELVEAAMPGGTLYPLQRGLVPFIGGVGGTVVASLTHLGYVNAAHEQILARGWPIPGASDLVVAMAAARVIFGRSAAVTVALVVALTSDVIGLAIISRRDFVADVHPSAGVLIAL